MSEGIRPGIKTVLDPLATDLKASTAEHPTDVQTSKLPVPPALAALDFGYTSFKPHSEKAKSLLGSNEHISCSVCKSQVDKSHSLALVCPHQNCTAVSHLSCLSDHFMKANPDETHIMPLDGHCPDCHTQTSWATLVKELSLRTRGQPILEKLFKAPRGKKAKDAAALQAGALTSTQQEQDDDDIDGGAAEEDDWFFQQFEDDIDGFPHLGDIVEMGSDDDQIPPSGQSQGSRWISPVKKDLVIDDSDWENAEMID
jgi:structure-specific endonuclease subunit SLX1